MRKQLWIALGALSFLLFPLTRAAAAEVLTWKDCIEEARKHNPDLISAEETINLQKADKSIVVSGLFPQINGDGAMSRDGISSGGSASTTTSGSTGNSFSYGFSGTQLVFDGFTTVNEIHAASENIQAAQQGYRFTSSQIRLDLRTAFVNLLTAQSLIRVAEEIVIIRRDNLGLITLRYKSGLEHRGAMMTADANLADADHGLSQAKRNITVAQRQMTKQMGRKEFVLMHAKGDFVVHDRAAEKPDFRVLADLHPVTQQLEAKKNAAAFGVRAVFGEFAPQVSGGAGVGKTDGSWPPQRNQWNMGLGVTLPIFSGGLRVSQVARAKAVYHKAEADERSEEDSVLEKLELAWAILQDTLENVDVQKKLLEANEERSRIAQAQYSTGFITFDNWIIIENDLVKSKKAYLSAQLDGLLAEADWIFAKGETLEYAQ